jgi:4'-phosphopantetheinyl transferase
MAYDEQIRDAGLLGDYAALLRAEEADRWRRFHFPRHRHQYLVTRALIRATLSGYQPAIDPDRWVFSKNRFGKPFLQSPAIPWPLRFNISHTDGLVVVAAALDRDLGVDTEHVEREGRHDGLAERFFSPAEADYLAGLPPEERSDRFFLLWTLKEAYIKARGKGLSIPLESFGFLFSDGGRIRFYSEERGDGPPDLRFWSFRTPGGHLISLGAQTGGPGENVGIRFFETVPFRNSHEVFYPIAYASV